MPKGFLQRKEDPRPTEVQALVEAGLKRQKMNRKALAARCLVPYPTLNEKLRDPAKMSFGLLIKILDTLQVPDDERRKIL